MNDRMTIDQEAANVAACVTTAERHGITPEQAENCDDNLVDCPDCPFSMAAVLRRLLKFYGVPEPHEVETVDKHHLRLRVSGCTEAAEKVIKGSLPRSVRVDVALYGEGRS